MAPVVYEVGLNFLLCFFRYLSIQQKFIKPHPPRRKHYFQISEKKTKLYNEGPVRWALMYMGIYGPFEKNEN